MMVAAVTIYFGTRHLFTILRPCTKLIFFIAGLSSALADNKLNM